MSLPAFVPGLSALSDRYDVLLCDVWGVIHNGVRSFPEACEALVRFGGTRGPVILISNAPRPGTDVLPQLDQLGVPRDAYAALVTSGDATRAELERRAGQPVWTIGPARDAPLYAGLDTPRADPEDAEYICCTGLIDDERETAEDYRAALTVAAGRELLFICANPDRVVQRGDRLIPCAGALADLYETLGGSVIMAGKPFAPIYALALAEAGDRLGRAVDHARVLAVGDGVPTDVKGAENQDLDCLFVAAGIHAADLAGEDGRPEPARAAAFLADADTRARWLTGELAW
jgi:HAD superfamily hydrolase (TIGR01459 family)